MNDQQSLNGSRRAPRAKASRFASPAWWLVFKQEFAEQWLGGRVLVLLILFSVMMSVTSVIQQTASQISLIPPQEIVFIVLQSAISFGLFLGLIVGADSISGERERGTLETLLLTPTSRVQIVIGKFLVALSPWPVAMALSIPYMAVLSQGDPVLGQALYLGSLMGSLLAVAFTALGMVASVWSSSNKVSLLVSLLVYIFFLIPTLWPGAAQKGDLGYAIQQLNPMQATSEFLEKVLVNNRTVQEKSSYMVAAIVAAAGMAGLLFFYAAPRLRLEGKTPGLSLPRLGLTRRQAQVATLLLAAGLMATLSSAVPIYAAASAASDQPLQISVDLDHKTTNTGDRFKFNTVVTNTGSQPSAPFHVSMNIIKLGSGDPVDPEDWSPDRSQAVGSLAPGKSATQSWEVNTIMEGNYMVYLTVIPTPPSADTTSQTISSSGIHVVVQPGNDTNPGGVLPVAIVIPAALIAGTVLVRWRWGAKTSSSEG
jgi:ABC-type transport system involved in cytochrome c biogenesis permease component